MGIRFIHFKEITLNKANITSDSCPFLDFDIPIFHGNFNTVLQGIPGKLDETPRVTEIKVRESFEKQLGISKERANVMLLTAVHRLPGRMDENKRNCIVRFSSLMDRDE